MDPEQTAKLAAMHRKAMSMLRGCDLRWRGFGNRVLVRCVLWLPA